MQCLVVFFIFFFNVCKINHLIILLLILIYFYVINGKFQMKIIIIKKREEKIPKVTQDSAKGNSMKRENFTWYTSSTFISRLAFNKLNLIFLSTPIFFLLWVVCTRKRKSERVKKKLLWCNVIFSKNSYCLKKIMQDNLYKLCEVVVINQFHNKNLAVCRRCCCWESMMTTLKLKIEWLKKWVA